jgi:hypothetical protein
MREKIPEDNQKSLLTEAKLQTDATTVLQKRKHSSSFPILFFHHYFSGFRQSTFEMEVWERERGVEKIAQKRNHQETRTKNKSKICKNAKKKKPLPSSLKQNTACRREMQNIFFKKKGLRSVGK